MYSNPGSVNEYLCNLMIARESEYPRHTSLFFTYLILKMQTRDVQDDQD